jgi:hypothetical protein
MIYANEGAGPSGTIYYSGGLGAQRRNRTRAVPKLVFVLQRQSVFWRLLR